MTIGDKIENTNNILDKLYQERDKLLKEIKSLTFQYEEYGEDEGYTLKLEIEDNQKQLSKIEKDIEGTNQIKNMLIKIKR